MLTLILPPSFGDEREMQEQRLPALDGDVILAAQALSLGIPVSDLVIATTNVGHLSQFVTADLWTNIIP